MFTGGRLTFVRVTPNLNRMITSIAFPTPPPMVTGQTMFSKDVTSFCAVPGTEFNACRFWEHAFMNVLCVCVCGCVLACLYVCLLVCILAWCWLCFFSIWEASLWLPFGFPEHRLKGTFKETNGPILPASVFVPFLPQQGLEGPKVCQK